MGGGNGLPSQPTIRQDGAYSLQCAKNQSHCQVKALDEVNPSQLGGASLRKKMVQKFIFVCFLAM